MATMITYGGPTVRVPVECSLCHQSCTTSARLYQEKPVHFCSVKCRWEFSSEERFWSHIVKTGPVVRPDLGECWSWTGRDLSPAGYPRMRIRGKRYFVHRLSYEKHVGPIPEGMNVLHRCDNPGCPNPSHLFTGTLFDNNRDRHNKGRDAFGERGGNTRFTEEQVRDILNLSATGLNKAEIARKYGTGRSTIWHIVRGETWRHISGING